VEPTGPDVALKKAELEERIRDVVEGYPVRLEVVSAMPLTLAGKHRWIVSDLVRARQQAQAVEVTS
jgi:hypothetical protein